MPSDLYPELQSELRSDRLNELADPSAAAPEWRAWGQLRLRYRAEDHELWTADEFMHLLFFRWLTQTGRMIEDGGPAAGDGHRATER